RRPPGPSRWRRIPHGGGGRSPRRRLDHAPRRSPDRGDGRAVGARGGRPVRRWPSLPSPPRLSEPTSYYFTPRMNIVITAPSTATHAAVISRGAKFVPPPRFASRKPPKAGARDCG